MSSEGNETLAPGENDGMNFKEEFFKYFAFWPWFLLSILFFGTCAYFYLRSSPKIYETNALIQILDPSTGIELQKSSFVFKRSSINLENEISELTSYPIIEETCKALDLNFTFYAVGTIKTTKIKDFPVPIVINSDSILPNQYGRYTIDFERETMEITTNTKKVIEFNSHNTKFNKALPFHFNSLNKPTGYLNGKTYIINVTPLHNKIIEIKNKIKVKQKGKDSDLLNLSLKDENPRISQVILNELMKIYQSKGISERQKVSQSTINFINKRFVRLIQELDSVEQSKETFKKTNKFVDVESDAKLRLELYTKSDEKYFNLQNQIEIVKSISELLRNREKYNYIPNILESASINKLIESYNFELEKYNSISLEAGSNNLSLAYAKERLDTKRVNINNSLERYLKDLQLRTSNIEKRRQSFDKDIIKYPTQERDSRSIERQLDIKETLYLFLLQKREEAAINIAITEPTVKIIENALISYTPLSPRPTIIYGISILVGFLLPFGVIFIFYLFDTKIHNREDVFKVNPNIPVIGELPQIKNKNNDKAKALFLDPNSNNILAESFRILSSNLDFILPKHNRGKVILCTSTIKGEGKTFVSINLSLALSSINKKTILIGADLRNPQIHKSIDYDKNNEGLSNYLYEANFDWRKAIIKGFSKHKYHDILLSGAMPPNPTHLLTNGNFNKLIEELRDEYDYIIIDSAPTILVTDTMLISEYVDASVFVTRADYTEKRLLEFSKDLNKNKKLKNMAYVINGVGSKKSYGYGYRYSYGYGYGYNYGYGYGYSSDEDDS